MDTNTAEAEAPSSKVDWDAYGRENSPSQRHLADPAHRALLCTFAQFFATQDRDSILLEIGCGEGFWLEVLRNLGFRHLFGIDLSRPLLEIAAEKGLDVRMGDVYDLEVDDVFDTVLLCDTLEHLPDPQAALRRVHRALRTQGLLYLAVPVYDSLADRYDRQRGAVTRQEQAQADDPTHLQAFSESPLLDLLEECHFVVDSAVHVGNRLPGSPPRYTSWTGGGRFGKWLCVAARSVFYVDWGEDLSTPSPEPRPSEQEAEPATRAEGEGQEAESLEQTEVEQPTPSDEETSLSARPPSSEGPGRKHANRDPDATELGPSPGSRQ